MDNFEKLQQLKQLLDEGILTQEEFDTRKEQLLFPERIEEQKRKAEEEKRKAEEEEQRKKERLEEESQKNIIFNSAISRFDVKTSESYKEGIAGLEELGDWKDANVLVEKYREELAEIESAEAEEKAEQDREDLYEKAINKFNVHTSKAFKSAIADLESLGDWKDAAEIAEAHKQELIAIEEEENLKKKKTKKRVIIAVAAIVVLCILGAVAKTLLTPDLAKFTPNKDMELNTMKYRIPEECTLEDSKEDSYALYTLRKGNKVVGAVKVQYLGDSDLSGQGGSVATSDIKAVPDKVKNLIPDASADFKQIMADNSTFGVAVYSNKDKVKGSNELLSSISDGFDVSGYNNPRTSGNITAKYTGDTSAGVKIDENNDGLTVNETYQTVLGAGYKEIKFKVDKPVTLEAGETSTVKIKAGDKKCELKITCTDRGAFYKDGKFTASFDDIMTDYIDNHDAIHLYGTSTSAGAHLNLYKKDEAYGGQMHVDTTGHDYIMVFSSGSADGGDELPANETPGIIMAMIQADGNEEVEDLMCFVAAFSNLLCTLDPSLDSNDAYENVKNALTSDDVEFEYKGIKYRCTDTSGLYFFKVE